MSETNDTPVPESEHSASWEEKKDALLLPLDDKLAILSGFEEVIGSIQTDTPVSDVHERITSFLTDIVVSAPGDMLEQLAAYEFTTLTLKQLNEQLHTFKSKSQEEDVPHEPLTLLLEAHKEIYAQFKQFVDDPEFHFYHYFIVNAKMLEEKFATIAGLEHNQEKINVYVKQTILDLRRKMKLKSQSDTEEDSDFDTNSILQSRISPFSLTVILKKEAFMPLSNLPTSSAFHITGTALSLVKVSTAESMDKSTRHESLHNYLDGIGLNRTVDFSKNIKDSLTIYKSLAANDPNAKRILKQVQQLKSATVINGVHEEIFASIDPSDDWQANYYKTGLIDETAAINAEQETNYTPFDLATSTFETAGIVIKRLYELYTEEGLQTEDPAMRTVLLTKARNLQSEWLKTVQTISFCLDFTAKYDDDALNTLYYLFLILKPAQYRHIPRLIRERHIPLLDDDGVPPVESIPETE